LARSRSPPRSLTRDRRKVYVVSRRYMMARVRSLEGREAGILAGMLQAMFRMVLGRPLNPIKVVAHAPRAMMPSVLANMILGSGRWAIGREMVQLVRIRVAARNGCPF